MYQFEDEVADPHKTLAYSLQKIEVSTRRRIENEQIKNDVLKSELSALRAIERESFQGNEVSKSADTASESIKRQDRTTTTRDVSFRREVR